MEQLKLHISEEDFRRFQENKLSEKEMEDLLSHVAFCTFCAGRLAERFEAAGLYRAPKNFKETVLAKAENLPAAPSLPAFSKRQQLFFYSARICVAMGIALFVLFALPEHMPSLKPEISLDAALPAREEPSLTERLNQILDSAATHVNEKMSELLSYHPLKEED